MVGGVRPGVNGAKGGAGAGRGVAGAAATEAGAGAAMANRSICGFFVDKDLCGRISGPEHGRSTASVGDCSLTNIAQSIVPCV